MTTPAFSPVGYENQHRKQPGERKRLKSWKPKKWRPEYERMVALSCLGWSNKMIAKELDYTKEHVSVILNMEEAETIRQMVLERMREKVAVSIPERLQKIAEKTVERLETAMQDDDLFEKSPFALIDRGMDVLKGLNHLKGGGNGSGGGLTVNVSSGGQAMVLSAGQADGLTEALMKANEVRKLHAAEPAQK